MRVDREGEEWKVMGVGMVGTLRLRCGSDEKLRRERYNMIVSAKSGVEYHYEIRIDGYKADRRTWCHW